MAPPTRILGGLVLLTSCSFSTRIEPVAPAGAGPAPRDAGSFTFTVPDAGGAGADPGPGPLPPPGWNCGQGCFVDSAVAQPLDRLGGPPDPSPASAPRLVYPLAGSLHPINIGDITFQWRRGQNAA